MPMIRIPHASHTFIETRHGLPCPLQLLSARALQQVGLVEDLGGLHISHADGALLAVDVGAANDGVTAGARGDGDFDAGVAAGEGGEGLFEEGAVGRDGSEDETFVRM